MNPALFRIDADDILSSIAGDFDGFAFANGAADLPGGRALGRPLWDFIADANTRQIYRELLTRVRSGQEVRVPLRCGAPDDRRLIELTLRPQPAGGVEFEARPMTEDGRAPQSLWEQWESRAGAAVLVCGWCKRVYVGGDWTDVEEATARLRLLESPTPPPLTHGICPQCLDAAMKQFRPE